MSCSVRCGELRARSEAQAACGLATGSAPHPRPLSPPAGRGEQDALPITAPRRGAWSMSATLPISTVSRSSRVGLNAANFFLAEVTGVFMPFLAKFLAERGWRNDTIGIAACLL